MPSTPIRSDDHGYLQESRAQVLRCVDGLGDYELRHPMTSTGTNLLGVVKHLIDGRAGADRDDAGDAGWWADYCRQLEEVAGRFRR